MEMGLTQTGSRRVDDWDAAVLKSRRKRAKDVDPRTAEERYEGYSREAVARRRERNRQGWADYYHKLASTHAGLAEEALRKAREYEAMPVPGHDLSPNGHGG